MCGVLKAASESENTVRIDLAMRDTYGTECWVRLQGGGGGNVIERGIR